MRRLGAYAIATILVVGVLYGVFAPSPSARLAAALQERRWQDVEALARAQLQDAAVADRGELYRALGLSHGAQGEYPAALEAFRNGAALLPEDAEMRRRMAIAMVGIGEDHEEEGEIDLALERYREAVELAPEIRHGHRSLVALLRAQGDVDESLTALERALPYIHHDVTLRLELAWLLASHPDPGRRDADRAVEIANEVLLHDRTPETLDTFAVALAALGEYEQAIRFERDAIELAGGAEGYYFEERSARLEAFRRGEPFVEGSSPGALDD